MVELKRILVPLDGSSLSERALPMALTLGRAFDSELILLRALQIPTSLLAPGEAEPGYWAGEAEVQMQQDAEAYLRSKQEELRRQGYTVRTLFSRDPAADEIIRIASEEQVDLIVMSTHGRSGIARWAFGSVADKVAHYSPCPILLVRQDVAMPGE